MKGPRTIHRQSIPDIITNDIRERILNGDLTEGTTIRQEAVAKEYGVSRIPVREALKKLHSEGLVELGTYRGAKVTCHSLNEIEEIFDLRIMLEVDLFRRAIPRMSADDIKTCEAILDAMEKSYESDDVDRWGGLNYDYHAALYAPAERKLTTNFLQKIGVQSDRYIRMNLSTMQQLAPATEEHRALLTHAREGNVEAGGECLFRHIERTKQQLLTLIEAKHS